MNRRDFLQATAGVAVASAFAGASSVSSAAPAVLPETQPIAPGTLRRFNDVRDWFFQKRFGLFLHWGLYSIAGWHEQYQWRGHVPRAEYAKLREQWNPVNFDPEKWLDLHQYVGMKYICLTTKHHDGFCLWDTKLTDFNTMNTPYGKDVLRMLADACHRRSIPLCLYYSCVDWNQKNYPNQGRSHELPPQPGDQPDLEKYLQFVKDQVRELCTNYGEIHGFWWDMNVDKHRDPSINQMIRKLQPAAVINNRGYDSGDFGTPERDYDSTGEERMPLRTLTEACQSVGSESWGYRKDEDYYTDAHLMRSIDGYLARDANYLLNVGPMPDGTIGPNETAILQRIGKWYQAVKGAVEDVESCSQRDRQSQRAADPTRQYALRSPLPRTIDRSGQTEPDRRFAPQGDVAQ